MGWIEEWSEVSLSRLQLEPDYVPEDILGSTGADGDGGSISHDHQMSSYSDATSHPITQSSSGSTGHPSDQDDFERSSRKSSGADPCQNSLGKRRREGSRTTPGKRFACPFQAYEHWQRCDEKSGGFAGIAPLQ